MQSRRLAGILHQGRSKAKPQVAHEFDLPLKSRKALTCGNVNAGSRGQKRKLKGREFSREFEFLSQNCPRDAAKPQVAGFRHAAALEIDRTAHTQA